MTPFFRECWDAKLFRGMPKQFLNPWPIMLTKSSSLTGRTMLNLARDTLKDCDEDIEISRLATPSSNVWLELILEDEEIGLGIAYHSEEGSRFMSSKDRICIFGKDMRTGKLFVYNKCSEDIIGISTGFMSAALYILNTPVTTIKSETSVEAFKNLNPATRGKYPYRADKLTRIYGGDDPRIIRVRDAGERREGSETPFHFVRGHFMWTGEGETRRQVWRHSHWRGDPKNGICDMNYELHWN